MNTTTSQRFAVAAVAALLQGCATMVNGTSQTVRIETDPPGARLTILPDGIQAVSPVEIELGRRTFRTVEARLEGYELTRAYVDRHVAGDVVAANVLIDPFYFLLNLSWGPVAADFASGGAFQLSPSPLLIKLTPLDDARSQ